MPIPTAWRAQQTTDTAGTGPLVLNAADTSRRSFTAVLGGASTAAIYLISQSGSSAWEIASGVFDGTAGLTRGTCLASSAGGAAVSWGAGRKDVILLSVPGQRARLGFSASATAALVDLGGLLDFTGSAAATLTLPAAASVAVGVGYLIRNSGTLGALLTVDGNASELVGTATTQFVCPGETLEIWSTGTGWLHSLLPPRALLRVYSLGAGVSSVDIALPAGSGAIYEIALRKVNPSANLQIVARTSTNGGVSFDAGASDYSMSYDFQDGASGANRASTVGSSVVLSDIYSSANIFGSSFMVDAGTAAMFPRIYDGQALGQQASSGLLARGSFGGGRAAVGPANALRVLTSAGNISGGTATVYLHRA
jgi:hypothetical protein